MGMAQRLPEKSIKRRKDKHRDEIAQRIPVSNGLIENAVLSGSVLPGNGLPPGGSRKAEKNLGEFRGIPIFWARRAVRHA
jgi:hypothetical protein